MVEWSGGSRLCQTLPRPNVHILICFLYVYGVRWKCGVVRNCVREERRRDKQVAMVTIDIQFKSTYIIYKAFYILEYLVQL